MEKTHKKHAEKELTKLRLKEDEVSDEKWIAALVSRSTFATLGTVFNDQPYVTPITFVYDPERHALFFHGAKAGRLRANIHFNNRVSVSLVESGDIFSHVEAIEFNIEYNSVTVFGKVFLLEDQDKVRVVLQSLLNKYAPHMTAGKDYQKIQDKEIIQTAVYQVKIDEWSGKRQQYDPDFYSGAFPYPREKTIVR